MPEIVHTEIYQEEYPPVEVYTFKNGAQVLRVGNELTELVSLKRNLKASSEDRKNGYNKSIRRLLAATRN